MVDDYWFCFRVLEELWLWCTWQRDLAKSSWGRRGNVKDKWGEGEENWMKGHYKY